MKRVGLIGLGIHGLRYAKHIVEDVANLELVAVCRRDAAAVELKDLKVYHGIYEEGEFIPHADAEPFALN